MNTDPNQEQEHNFIHNPDLSSFKTKTDELMTHLEANDIDNALKCINEINDINGQSFYSIIGKLTRGLHNAIADLSISSAGNQSVNNKTRVDLNYVISLTDEAAQKTLDMTEKSMVNLGNLKQNSREHSQLIEDYLASNTPDDETSKLIKQLAALNEQSMINTNQLGVNISEITLAQNFQDITSQSITKAIGIVNDVESSLIVLTQHANLLSKISQYSDKKKVDFHMEDTEELKSDISQMQTMEESEHLDQNDVDNLLSSLGF